MVYNLTNLTSSTGTVADLGTYAASVTNGLFWGILTIAIFIILVINLRNNGIDRAVAAASFGMLIISVFMLLLGWILWLFPIVYLFMLAGTLFYIHFKNPE